MKVCCAMAEDGSLLKVAPFQENTFGRGGLGRLFNLLGQLNFSLGVISLQSETKFAILSSGTVCI